MHEVGFEFHPDQTSYFTHPPFIVPLVRLITNEDYVASLTRWTLVLLLLNGIGTFVLTRTVAGHGFQKRDMWILAAGTFLFWPTFSGLMNGQDVTVLLLGTSIFLLYFFQDNAFVSGLGLSLTALRPQLALMLAVPLLIRNWKVFLGLAVGGAVLALFSVGLIRSNGLADYLRILRVVEGGLWHLPHTKDMPSIAGILRRNFAALGEDFFRYAVWSLFVAGVAGVSLWWRRQRMISEQQIGLLILLGLLFVPYSHYHELILLLIPVFCLIRVLSERRLVSTEKLALLPLGVSFVLFLGFIGSEAAKFSAVYVVMILLGYFLIFPERITSIHALYAQG